MQAFMIAKWAHFPHMVNVCYYQKIYVYNALETKIAQLMEHIQQSNIICLKDKVNFGLKDKFLLRVHPSPSTLILFICILCLVYSYSYNLTCLVLVMYKKNGRMTLAFSRFQNTVQYFCRYT